MSQYLETKTRELRKAKPSEIESAVNSYGPMLAIHEYDPHSIAEAVQDLSKRNLAISTFLFATSHGDLAFNYYYVEEREFLAQVFLRKKFVQLRPYTDPGKHDVKLDENAWMGMPKEIAYPLKDSLNAHVDAFVRRQSWMLDPDYAAHYEAALKDMKDRHEK